MLKDFFAGIAFFFSSVLGISDAQTGVFDAPPADPPAVNVVALEAAPATTTGATYITQPIIERIVQQPATVPQTSTRAEFDAKIASLRSEFLMLTTSGKATEAGALPVSSDLFRLQVDRIYDSLGDSISNARTELEEQTAAATAANYLSLAGGTLTGAFSGTDISLSGTLTALSTTATTTLGGGLSVGTNGLTVLQNGRVGAGTATPRAPLEVGSGGGILFGLGPNNSVNISNPSFGYGVENTDLTSGGYNTMINGRLAGQGGIAVIIGGLQDTTTSGSNFNTIVGPGSVTKITGASVNSSVFGRGASIVSSESSTAIGFGASVTQSNNTIAVGNAVAGIILGGDFAPTARLTIKATSTSATGAALVIRNSTDVELFRVRNDGNVGIGTTTPWRSMSVTGNVGFDGLTGNFGTGSLCLTANKEVVYNSGSDACLSSTRATKHDVSPLDLDALAAVIALQPVSFVYNGDESSSVRYGFIAEDAEAIDRSLATHDDRGKVSGIDDRGILSVIIKALQELITTVAGFAQRITTQTLLADNVTAVSGTFQTLCVGATCVTEAEFNALFDKHGVSSAPTPTEISTSSAPEGQPIEEESSGEFSLEPVLEQ